MDTFEGIKPKYDIIVVSVYKLVHSESGKFYIGSTGNFYNRRKSHITALRGGCHPVKELQELYAASPHFRFELDSIGINHSDPDVRERAYDREQYLIDQYWGNLLLQY